MNLAFANLAFDHATPITFLLLLFTLFQLLWMMRRALLNPDKIFVRRIAGINAIDEACGRAAELGRPMAFTSGLTNIGPVLSAALAIMHYIARKAARLKSKLLLPQSGADVLALAEEVARDAYRLEGKANNFDQSQLVYLSDEQFAFAAGYIGLVQRENVASTFLCGAFSAESLVLAEAGQQVGAMQVSATVSPEQVAFFITACDYTLIGEELYAAAAYLSRDAKQLGNLLAQDRIKAVFLIIIIIGISVATWNSIMPEKALPFNVQHLIAFSFAELYETLMRFV